MLMTDRTGCPHLKQGVHKIHRHPSGQRLSHTAALTKAITITMQRECIILVEWVCAVLLGAMGDFETLGGSRLTW